MENTMPGHLYCCLADELSIKEAINVPEGLKHVKGEFKACEG
jgi:hypothetical protein